MILHRFDRIASVDDYQRAVGSPLPPTIIGGMDETTRKDRPPLIQAVLPVKILDGRSLTGRSRTSSGTGQAE